MGAGRRRTPRARACAAPSPPVRGREEGEREGLIGGLGVGRGPPVGETKERTPVDHAFDPGQSYCISSF